MKSHNFTLKFEHRKNYLYARVEGEDSYSASLEYWGQISDEAHKFEFDRVLIHENMTGEVSEGEIFNLLMDIMPSGRGIKVALFDENSADLEINTFGQLVANNRGLHICIFQSLEAATTWILED